VVLVLEHGVLGAVGVVLNRPMEVEVGEILAPWQDLAAAAPPGVIFSGGPVSPDAVIGLARPVAAAPDAGWRMATGELAVVDLSVAPPDQPAVLGSARLYSGYAGWDAEQLEAEIGEGAWFVLDALADDVLAPEPERLWHDVLQRQGGKLAMLASYPPNPMVN
jgi:putative transcriptional regulator